jgi:hypothetical protein
MSSQVQQVPPLTTRFPFDIRKEARVESTWVSVGEESPGLDEKWGENVKRCERTYMWSRKT